MLFCLQALFSNCPPIYFITASDITEITSVQVIVSQQKLHVYHKFAVKLLPRVYCLFML